MTSLNFLPEFETSHRNQRWEHQLHDWWKQGWSLCLHSAALVGFLIFHPQVCQTYSGMAQLVNHKFPLDAWPQPDRSQLNCSWLWFGQQWAELYLTALLSITGSLKIYLIIFKTKTHTQTKISQAKSRRGTQGAGTCWEHGWARGKGCFSSWACWRGSESGAGYGEKLWEGFPKLRFSPLFFLCKRRQLYSFLHRLLAKNKQTKAGMEQGPLQAAGN